MKIKISRADALFSEFIRLRDGKCVRCGARGEANAKGQLIVGLQCSHFFGRAGWSTRFDPENCDALCFGCHQYWGSRNREDYRQFKIRQLGEQKFQLLIWRAKSPAKKNSAVALLIVKQLLTAQQGATKETT